MHPAHLRPTKIRFLPIVKIYWFKIKLADGREIYIAKRAQDWSSAQGKFIDGLPCPYAKLAQQFGYRAAEATDEMQLNERHPPETLARAVEEAAKIAAVLVPGPFFTPVDGFIAGDGI